MYSEIQYHQPGLWDQEPKEKRPEFKLREYQVQTISLVEKEFELGRKRVILQAPCGSGKTIMAAELIRRAVEKAEDVLFLAHRRELVFQCSDKLDWLGIDHGVLMAGKRPSLMPSVQVASVQTLIARFKRGVIALPPAHLLIFDECHHNNAKTHLELIGQYPDARIIGLTATPMRGDGNGLGVRK